MMNRVLQQEQQPDTLRYRSRSYSLVIDFDGQQWDLSNLCDPTWTDEDHVESLYPPFWDMDGIEKKEPFHKKPPSEDLKAAARQPSRPAMDKADSLVLESSRALFGAQECLVDEINAFMVEVFPGMDLPLRGSFETRKAIRRGTIARVECMECNEPVHCVDDAAFILCPICRCVSPLECFAIAKDGAYGVGLGFLIPNERACISAAS